MDETRIRKGLKNREERSILCAIEQYSRLLGVVASRHLSKTAGFNEHDIEECVADVFLELWQNFEKYDPEKGSLKTYLCVLTHRKAIDRYRSKTQVKIISLEEVQQNEEPGYEDDFDIGDYNELYSAIMRLPEPTREILIRRFFFDEKPSTIAKKMNLPQKEIDNRLYRAKQSLAYSLPLRFEEVL